MTKCVVASLPWIAKPAVDNPASCILPRVTHSASLAPSRRRDIRQSLGCQYHDAAALEQQPVSSLPLPQLLVFPHRE
jgi:hypothetical protein